MSITVAAVAHLAFFLSFAAGGGYEAVVFPVTKDGATNLYTLPINRNFRAVIDLAGPLVVSNCPDQHPNLLCGLPACRVANQYSPKKCSSKADFGEPFKWAGVPCRCVASAVNPVTGECGSGTLTTATAVTVAATDGHTTLSTVTAAVTSLCASYSLLKSLPAGSTGVAGFGSSSLALPSQLDHDLKFEKKFGLCLPSVAVVGGGPFYLVPFVVNPPPVPPITSRLSYTKLLSTPANPGYYLDVTGIAVDQKEIAVASRALALDVKTGDGGVALSTVVPYAALRPDIYSAFIKAFDTATSSIARAKAVPPFELCYKLSALSPTLSGFFVPQIDLILADGQNWTFYGANSVAQVSSEAACLAFVKAPGSRAAVPPAAVAIGGFQLENNFLQFDEAKKQLGFSGLLVRFQTTCSNFLGFQKKT